MGMEITKTFTVAAPRSAVWDFLTDPHKVAGCLPGAAITEQVDDTTYAGTMTVKVGPVTAAYKGKLHFDRLDEAAGEAELSAAAQETRGKGGADMRMKSTLAESDGATEVTVVSDVNVVGVLAQFGRGMIQDVSDQLFVRFSDCMRDQLEGESAAEATEVEAAAEVEAAPDKARLGIPSLNLFGSRNAPGVSPSEGHLDFSPMIAPRGEELIALSDVTGKIYGDMGLTPSFVGGLMFHPRTMICFHAVPTYRNAADNQRIRQLFETLVRDCSDRGWPIYRIHAHFQRLGMQMFDFNDGALHRLHETLKDAIDPNGIVSAGRYDIWPRHLRGTRA
jgi:carbon monoxide dehydrogenase subunit G